MTIRLHLFPSSSRSLGVVALKNHLAIDCELVPIDLGRGDPTYLRERPGMSAIEMNNEHISAERT